MIAKIGIFILMMLGSLAAQADEVFLKNGDRITGTIVNKSGGLLEIKTAYADKLLIKWDAVESFKSDQPVLLTLKNKEELTGITSTAKGNSLTIKKDGVYESNSIPLTEIKEVNKKYFSGQANFGGGLSDGNTQRQSYHTDAEVVVRGRDDRVSFGGQFNYADSTNTNSAGIKETELNARNFQIYADYSHFFTDSFYGYAHGLFTNDRLQDIQLRSAFGVGVGYQILATDDINLSLEGGPDYLNVDFYNAPFRCGAVGNPCIALEDRSDFAGRWSLKYDQWILSRVIQLFHNHEGIVSSDFYIRTRTGFRVPIWNGLQFTNEVQVDYFSNPSPGKKSTDTRYMFSLGYGF